MIDEENSNITYKQISTAFIIIDILVIAILIMASAYTIMVLSTNIYTAIKDGATPGITSSIILGSILLAFLLYSLTINLIICFKEYRMTIDKHLLLLTILTYLSVNIPCAVMLNKRIKNKEE